MEFEIKNDEQSWRNLQTVFTDEIRENVAGPFGSKWWSTFVWVGIGVCLGLGISLENAFHWPTALFVLATFGVWKLINALTVEAWNKATLPKQGGLFLSATEYRLDEEGIHVKTQNHSADYGWPVISRVLRRDGLILFYTDSVNALVFPEEQLPDPDAVLRLVADKVESVDF